MYTSFIVKKLIPTLIISLLIAASHAKSSKNVVESRFPRPRGIQDNDDLEALTSTRREVLSHDDASISGLIRGKRDLISDSDEEMTSTSETSDMEGEEATTESTFGYGDDVETTTTSFSTKDSDKFKYGSSSNESTSGLDRLLQLMKRRHYNPYEIPKMNLTNALWFSPDGSKTFPVHVWIYLNIRSVSNIDEIYEEVSLDIDLITQWWDGKLQEWYLHNNQTLQEEYRQTWPQANTDAGVPLDSKILKNFWTPDISIEKLAKVSSSKILSRSERLGFQLWGRFTYVKRMTVKVNCEMDFTYYPADTQECNFTMRSYSYNANDLGLYWRQPEGVYLMETGDSNFDLQVVDVKRYNITTKKKRHCWRASEDRESCDGFELDPEEYYYVLHFTLHMRRKISYQLLQTYIPSALYIAITWLCFMIPPKMVEGRIAIAMTTLLTLTAMFSSVRENTPIVSYIKAIDIWMAAGIVFIFLVLLEFTVLLWTEAGKKSKEELEANEEETAATAYERSFNWLRGKATTLIGVVEYYSFVIILFMTMSFNIAYWTWLFVASGYFGWTLDDWHNSNGGANKYEDKMGDQLECLACHYK